MDALFQVFNSIAFPVAVCIICFWYINKLTEQHKAEVDKLSEALNNNTLVMQQICSRLDAVGVLHDNPT